MQTLVDSSSVSDTQLDSIINQGLYEVSVLFPWPWLETSISLSLDADIRYVDLPDNFDYGIAVVDDEHDTALQHVGAKTFFSLVGNDTGNSGSHPEFYTIFEGKLYVHPIPSEADSERLTLYYYTEVSQLAYDSDEPLFHKAYHWLLVEYAKWKVYEREEYYDQSERSFILYTRYVQDMMAWYGSPMKRAPFLWGDGRQVRRGDPHLPILDI